MLLFHFQVTIVRLKSHNIFQWKQCDRSLPPKPIDYGDQCDSFYIQTVGVLLNKNLDFVKTNMICLKPICSKAIWFDLKASMICFIYKI